MINDFYRDKKVLITGHTGFKGSWMCRVLLNAGAYVSGYALKPADGPALYNMAGMLAVDSHIGDICDLDHLMEVFDEVQPEIVIHMAAQPLVRESYKDPVGTYNTNVMGTVNVLECVRTHKSVKSFVNVTTDKVYLNREWEWGYRENEELNGYDPYSNSKSCSELVTQCYKNSFFKDMKDRDVAISTMRAGNVIGGGDFAKDRIIPDCVRAALKGEDITVRNPYSTRPYQHVLEPVMAYLMVAMRQYEDTSLAGNYNIGPDDRDCYTTGNIVELFCNEWNNIDPNANMTWINASEENAPHEANFLKLDCSRIKNTFGWKPVWDIGTAIEKTVLWTVIYAGKGDIPACMDMQIKDYLSALYP